MRPLSASDIITVWETGQRLHPLKRAIALLAAAYPERSPQQLTMLSVGQRDRRLLALRQMTLGSQLHSLMACPHCGDSLEFSLNINDICVSEISDNPIQNWTIQLEDIECQVRLPNSQDLALLTGSKTVEEATRSLVERCVLQISRAGTPVALDALSPEMLERLGQQISSCDPQAEVLLDLLCPACGQQWQTLFDIVSFFWAEMEALARSLLQEVHVLARAYGWHEADILAMSAVRRQFYLEMVG